MKEKFISLICIAMLLIPLSGCMQISAVLKVKPDGSGTIAERFVFGKEAIELLKKMKEKKSQSQGGEDDKGAEGAIQPGRHDSSRPDASPEPQATADVPGSTSKPAPSTIPEKGSPESLQGEKNGDINMSRQGRSYDIIEGSDKAGGGLKGSAGGSTDIFGDFNDAYLKTRAGELGNGVTVVDGRRINDETGEGFEATYAFPDVTRLRMNTQPAPKGQMSAEASQGVEQFGFRFDRSAAGSKVSIAMPEMDGSKGLFKGVIPQSEKKMEVSYEAQKKSLEIIKTLMKGMRMIIAVEFDGEIRETDATYREGNRIVLIDLDIDRMEIDQEMTKKLNEHPTYSIQEMVRNAGPIPGIRVEWKKTIQVLFR
jgi:hypothetical protein